MYNKSKVWKEVRLYFSNFGKFLKNVEFKGSMGGSEKK